MVELILLALFTIAFLAIKTILWFQESRFTVLENITSFVGQIISGKDRLYNIYPGKISRDIIVEFIPVKKAHDITFESTKKLQGIGYRMLTGRERSIIKKQYENKTEFKDFIVLFPHQVKPKDLVGNLSCMQWTERGVEYSRNASIHDIQRAIRIKLFALGDSMKNKFFLAATMGKRNRWMKFLDSLYDTEVTLLRYAFNPKKILLKIRQRVKKAFR